jgi:hypothetical protein
MIETFRSFIRRITLNSFSTSVTESGADGSSIINSFTFLEIAFDISTICFLEDGSE